MFLKIVLAAVTAFILNGCAPLGAHVHGGVMISHHERVFVPSEVTVTTVHQCKVYANGQRVYRDIPPHMVNRW